TEASPISEPELPLKFFEIPPLKFPSEPLPPMVNLTPPPAPSLDIEVERVPLILKMVMQMRVPEIIDQHYEAHGNHQGLSVGWLAALFVVYMLTESNHKMVTVREWVKKTPGHLGKTDGAEDQADRFHRRPLGRCAALLE
ncbi:MAG: hypothetical protein GY934_24160, partial [Gammaproteobacteria bacterium]|nr:hypothetical protein [Gammaproteobacteria bacterium]